MTDNIDTSIKQQPPNTQDTGDASVGAENGNGEANILEELIKAIKSLQLNVTSLSLGQELCFLAMQPKASMEKVISIAQNVDGIKEQDIQEILKELGEGANLKSLAGAIVKKHGASSMNKEQQTQSVSDDDEVGDTTEGANPIESIANLFNNKKKGVK